VICPFLRAEVDGVLHDPANAVADDHRCDAIGGARVISAQQQELMCLRSAHVDCPRYRRAVASPAGDGDHHVPAVPRAIAASLVVLALAAGISFGFVVARGGIDLPASPHASGIAAVPSQSAAPGSSQTASPAPTAASEAPSVPPTEPPTNAPTEPPTAAPTPTPTQPPTEAPTEAPTVAPSPSALPSPSASGVPSASRLAVLKPCPGKSGCYLYTIRSGDNLFSIAHWFGVPLDTIYAWNPTLKKTGIHAGMVIKIPTPTR
jgi:LysM repeat protein